MRDARIQFSKRSPFFTELKAEIDAYFAEPGRSVRDVGAMYRKTATILVWWLAALITFLAFDWGWAGTIGLGVVMGLGMAGIGMSVMHDGGHKAYSSNKLINEIMSYMLDLQGGSAYLWNYKHNVQHHTYPNVVGADDDIDVGVLARLAPDVERLSFHRWQHFYMWPLYGMLTIKWHLMDDFQMLIRGKIGDHPFPPMKRKDWIVFWAGKVIFVGWALVLPFALKPAAMAFAFYFTSQFVQGFVLGATFQLAHCVEEAAYFEPTEDGAPVKLDFAKHQLATTVDFATQNPLATWYMGGLNFQAIHHLFPRICHIHYPAMSKIVARVAEKHGVHYQPTPTVRAALRSHYRWIRALGRNDEVVAPAHRPAPGDWYASAT